MLKSQLFLINASNSSMKTTMPNFELLLFSKLNYKRLKENEIVLCFYSKVPKVKSSIHLGEKRKVTA
jgi:hypothetical protein